MKQEKSKISVLMSVYKKENPEYLRASLESILVQTRTADEILLIEDGPLTQELYQVYSIVVIPGCSDGISLQLR